ncbi:MAG: radical SAM protein [Acidobacteriota bacterium]
MLGAKGQKIEAALARLNSHESECRLCPRDCGVNRAKGERGYCLAGVKAAVSHALLHYGEEPVLSGRPDCTSGEPGKCRLGAGSGTIFFTGCSLKCSFCQNYQLSWLGHGKETSPEELAAMMLRLQDQGALNINLVSPTHLILPVLRALRIAYGHGLALPLVANSSGYEKAEVIALLDGIVDIYLPDLKYFSPGVAGKLSGASDYFAQASEAVKEMAFQRPQLVFNKQETAEQGLIVRHLVLPGQTADSIAILEWLARELGPGVSLSLMSQYHPCFQAPEELRRLLRPEEYREVLARAEELEFEYMFVQPEGFSADDHLFPDFKLDEPFRWGGGRRGG